VLAFKHHHYVASLRTKKGEFDAVKRLPTDVLERFTPLWEAQPTDDTSSGQDPSKPLDEILEKTAMGIHTASNGLKGFVDCRLLHKSRRRSTGNHPIQWLCGRAATLGTILTPVVGLDSDSAYIAAARSAHASTASDIALRLDVADPLATSTATVTALVAALGVTYESLHLILDLGYLDSPLSLPVSLPTRLNRVLALGAWKSVTLMSGAIPETYSRLKPGLVSIGRFEWPVWCGLVAAGVLSRRPAFGDYGLSHAKYKFIPIWATGSAKIRYSDLGAYLIFLGRSLKSKHSGGYGQFPVLAAQAAAHPSYRGVSYSAGDKRISDCASRVVKTGNATTWVEASTNLHIAYVARLVPTVP